MGQSRLNDNYSAGKLFFVNLTLYINQRQVLPVMVLLPGLTPGSRIQVLNQIWGQIEVGKEEHTCKYIAGFDVEVTVSTILWLKKKVYSENNYRRYRK